MNGIRTDLITNTYSTVDPNREIKKFKDNNEGRLMYVTIANKETNSGNIRVFVNSVEHYEQIAPGSTFSTVSRVLPYGVVDVNEYSYEWVLTGEGVAVADGDQVMISLHRYTQPIKDFCPK